MLDLLLWVLWPIGEKGDMVKIPYVKKNPVNDTKYKLLYEKKRTRKKDYLREHDFPACLAWFPISPRFLIVFSHVCQVALSPILQAMNNSHIRNPLRAVLSKKKLARNIAFSHICQKLHKMTRYN